MSRAIGALLFGVTLLPGVAFAATGDVDPDPWQGFNRFVFLCNEVVDEWALEPVAVAYDWVVPDAMQGMVTNFSSNLSTPTVFVNNLLQGKPGEAAEDLARLAINTTFGLGGVIDIAGAGGVVENDEDFGQTLGVWGVPSGPYLVLPFFGPSSPRDATGQLLGAASDVHSFFVPLPVSLGISGLRLVNLRSSLLQDIRDAREASFDYYVFLRNVYIQYRTNAVADRDPQSAEPPVTDDDLYGFDDEEDLYFPDDGGEDEI